MEIKEDKSILVLYPKNYYRDLKKIKNIVLHHRCGTGSVKSIHEQHKSIGYIAIGYHYYIRFSGEVWRGRPIQCVGAHCKGYNTNSIGICLEGDFRKQKPTKNQIAKLKELIEYIEKVVGHKLTVYNHKDLFPTECPVINLKEMIK